MRILLLCHSFNSLAQRLFVVLREAGHEVSVEFDVNDDVTVEAATRFDPQLVVAPFLKRVIPAQVWRRWLCLVVHPGIVGDRGASALDWAVLEGASCWGVTVLEAGEVLDGGDIWADARFPMREAGKASLYRREVCDAAVACVRRAIARFESGAWRPRPLDYDDPSVRGRPRRSMKQADRAIDWQADDTATVLRKIRSADGFPGVRDRLGNRELYLYDARRERSLRGPAGALIARCSGAVCRATPDGAVWIGHLRDRSSPHPFKLPATRVLDAAVQRLPEVRADAQTGYRDLWYEERGAVGYLHFPFYNGAMSTEHCERLREAFAEALRRDTRVIVLTGGPDFWSNGMHLHLIEAADSPAEESWRNINAIDDLAADVINATSHVTVAALRGNAGAGGVFLARAADHVWAHGGVVLNPHYKDMGNLYGSEYWTYLLPRCCGDPAAREIMRARLPMGAREAMRLGVVDECFDGGAARFEEQVEAAARRLADADDFADRIADKRAARERDEAHKPLAAYRAEELEHMRRNFFGFDPSYHVARYHFVHRTPKSRTPLTIAVHRRSEVGRLPTAAP